MKKQLIQAAFAVIAYCGILLPAYAAPIEGASSCLFENAVGGTGMVTSGVGTSSFTWGTGVDSPPSGLDCVGQSFDTNTGVFFDVGEITYFNGAINAGTGADSVDLSLSLAFTDPVGISENFIYLLSLVNTPNTGTAQEQADIVQFPVVLPTQSFNIGGLLYTLALEVGEVTEGGFSTQTTFSVLEGESATATLRGKVTIAQVPVTGSLALLVIGLAGVGWTRRRTKS
ncbi:MAG: hypothetical protein ACI97K_001360 [Glaciecola sp.]|jgi:hypothetical protein